MTIDLAWHLIQSQAFCALQKKQNQLTFYKKREKMSCSNQKKSKLVSWCPHTLTDTPHWHFNIYTNIYFFTLSHMCTCITKHTSATCWSYWWHKRLSQMQTFLVTITVNLCKVRGHFTLLYKYDDIVHFCGRVTKVHLFWPHSGSLVGE